MCFGNDDDELGSGSGSVDNEVQHEYTMDKRNTGAGQLGSMSAEGLDVTAAACLDYCDSLSTGICQYVTFGPDAGDGRCTIFAAGCGVE